MVNPKKVEYWVLTYNELDNLVQGNLNLDWDFVSSQEASNDSSHVVHPDKEGIEDDYLSSDSVIGELIKQEILPDGIYLIEVCW